MHKAYELFVLTSPRLKRKVSVFDVRIRPKYEIVQHINIQLLIAPYISSSHVVLDSNDVYIVASYIYSSQRLLSTANRGIKCSNTSVGLDLWYEFAAIRCLTAAANERKAFAAYLRLSLRFCVNLTARLYASQQLLTNHVPDTRAKYTSSCHCVKPLQEPTS